MPKHVWILWLFAFLLLLGGCQSPEAEAPVITESTVWEEMPKLTYGVMACDRLEVLPWYGGRLEATGGSSWAETELGYYRSTGTRLQYADKANIGNWVYLCNQPNCAHSERNTGCNANLDWSSFVIRNGRIYILLNLSMYPELYPQIGDRAGFALCSRALNGTDLQLEYVMEDGLISGGGGICSLLTQHYWYCGVSRYNTDGSSTRTAYLVTENGEQILTQDASDDYPYAYLTEINGDPMAVFGMLEDQLYLIQNGQVKHVDALKYVDDIYSAEAAGNYVSGNIMRQFRSGDGYYDIDLETGKEIFVAPPHLKNSRGFLLLPNCVVEITVGSDTLPEEATREAALFDGVQWRSIRLPQQIVNASSDAKLFCLAAASDRLFFTFADGGHVWLCQLMLTENLLTLEVCCQLN